MIAVEGAMPARRAADEERPRWLSAASRSSRARGTRIRIPGSKRESAVSVGIYRRHIALYRFLNDAWIFAHLLRPELKRKAVELLESTRKKDRHYPVPKRGRTVTSRRKDYEIGQIFKAQHETGLFQTNIVSIVSRFEAHLQECMLVVILEHPKKLSLIAKEAGVPVDLFLADEEKQDVLSRFVALQCERLMFGKPADYLKAAFEVLSIEIDDDLCQDYIEIKATRDIVVHGGGKSNRLYDEKAGAKKRAEIGEDLPVDYKYFKHVITVCKSLAGSIQSKTEAVYK